MNKDRGMMKWMPYKSLVDQQTVLYRMRQKKAKVDKPKVSAERAEEINRALVDYAGERVRIRYWKDGVIYEVEATISRIDGNERFLLVEEERIPFSCLIQIEQA